MCRKKWLAVAGLAIVVILTLTVCLILRPNSKPAEPVSSGSPKPVESVAKQLVLSVIGDTAGAIKDELELAVRDMLDENPESARRRVSSVLKDISGLRKTVDQGIAMLEVTAPSKAKRLEDARVLLDVADVGLREIMLPAIDLIEQHPVSALKVGDGFNVRLLGTYIDFAESIMPKAGELLDRVNAVDLSFLGEEMGEYLRYLEFANKAMDIYRADPAVLTMVKTMLGAESDRLYVITVQNPAEIRASGGFPGSVGTMRVTDGVLTMGDFTSVLNMFSPGKPSGIQIEREEREMFSYLSGFHTPWDSGFCPDFERVGHIWSLSYEEKRREAVDGVISVSPHIVQRLLAVTGEEIELFDGTVLNGDNALKVLLHDIYYKYFSKNYVAGRGEISDELFAEAAKKTMELLVGNISVTQMLEYLPVVKECIEDRTLMFWMKDEQEQAYLARMGWHGGLNQDPSKPEAGVYFNLVLASKLGWYVLMDTQMGERIRNEDGSYTYPVTVTLVNSAEMEEIRQASTYISGGRDGALFGVAYFFAPAGGTVTDFAASNGQTIQLRSYHGLELGFMEQFTMRPGASVTITYSVTTAPNVDAPLVFKKSPTAQDYAEALGIE